jgi:sugar phosphate permease
MNLPALYVASTEQLLGFLAISHQMGHLGAGLIIYAVMMALVGARQLSALPLVAVVIAELFNETVQAAFYGSWRTADTIGDIIWTVGLPLLLFLHAAWLNRHRTIAAIPSPVRLRR